MSQSRHPGQKFSELLSELKQDYLVAFPQKIEKIKSLLENENWTDLAEEYHKLKGTGKTYGFPEVSVLCEQLELLARQTPPPQKAMFENATAVLERIRLAYAQGQILDLLKDVAAKSILALKSK